MRHKRGLQVPPVLQAQILISLPRCVPRRRKVHLDLGGDFRHIGKCHIALINVTYFLTPGDSCKRGVRTGQCHHTTTLGPLVQASPLTRFDGHCDLSIARLNVRPSIHNQRSRPQSTCCPLDIRGAIRSYV